MTPATLHPILQAIFFQLHRYRLAYDQIMQSDPLADDLGHAAMLDLTQRMLEQARVILERTDAQRGSSGGARVQPNRFDRSRQAPSHSDRRPRLWR